MVKVYIGGDKCFDISESNFIIILPIPGTIFFHLLLLMYQITPFQMYRKQKIILWFSVPGHIKFIILLCKGKQYFIDDR